MCATTYFHIDVCIVRLAQKKIVRDDPLVAQGHTIFHDTLLIISLSIAGYPSLSYVFHKNLLEFFVHFPSSIHGDLGLAKPHGPCIINMVMVLCNSGNSSSSGVSVHTMSSMSFGRCGFVVLSQIAKM